MFESPGFNIRIIDQAGFRRVIREDAFTLIPNDGSNTDFESEFV